MNKKQFISDENAMLALGAAFAKTISKGYIIFLEGNLGAGKTTFVRGFLQALGFSGTVKSPTYTLVESYLLNSLTVYHFDLYRLVDPEELEFMGFRDYMESGAICFIEWPEHAEKLLAKPNYSITISIPTDGVGRWVEVKDLCLKK
jgi:tRNA threonylcarbamoyladenosine biosynthesis protein TsaE